MRISRLFSGVSHGHWLRRAQSGLSAALGALLPGLALVMTAISPVQATTTTLTTSGNWTVPAGVTSVTVEVWGGGGAGGGVTGNKGKGGGGAGGQYARKVLTGISGSIPVVVGAGGVASTGAGTAGGDSSVNGSAVVAKGGAGGAGTADKDGGGAAGLGSATGGVGDVVYAGGSGSAGVSGGRGGSGGAGGGGAGSTGPGGNANNLSAGSGAANGGGNGAAGLTAAGNGSAGIAAGGGGGGGYTTNDTNRNGGAGAAGKIIITYTDPTILSITRLDPSPTKAASVSWTVVFSQSVSGVKVSNFSLVNSGLTGGPAITGVSGSGTTWTVTASTGSGVGTLGLNAANFSGIAPLPTGTLPVTGEVYEIDRTSPKVLSIELASANPTTLNSPVAWTVVFSTKVKGVDVSDFVLVPGGSVTGATITSLEGSGTTYTVKANTGTAVPGSLGLNLKDKDSIFNLVDTPLAGLGTSGESDGSFTGKTYTLVNPWPTLGKTVSAGSAAVGSAVSFNITASNSFAVPLSNVKVSDILPVDITYLTHLASTGTVSRAGQVITWTIPTLAANESAQLTLIVSLDKEGKRTNTVTSPGATDASASILVLAGAVTHFKMDEATGSWKGVPGEVIDSGGTGLNGNRLSKLSSSKTNTVDPKPTIAAGNSAVIGGFCNAGSFPGDTVVEVKKKVADDFAYTTTVSASAWIYPTKYNAELSSILSNDTNYEFHLDTKGKLYWWWNASSLTSNTSVPLNQWTHVAITMDSSPGAGRQRIYINGKLDTSTGNWKGSLEKNACNFYIGGDIATSSPAGKTCDLIDARNFQGMIDEVKLYKFELSEEEVVADMTLGRLCTGAFDHLRILHNGSGSACSPTTVTVKACLDPQCSTVYPGPVNATLSPSGWLAGDNITLSGVTSAQYSQGSAGKVVFGAVASNPKAVNATRCFNSNGSLEIPCDFTFSAATCTFDAVETSNTGALSDPRRIYTKLAGVPFTLDVLALKTQADQSINTAYVGKVTVDLVDACPSGNVLVTVPTSTLVEFKSTEPKTGRRPFTFTYPDAASNVWVRIKEGTSAAACSTDNFSIRPQQFLVSSSSMSNTTLAGTPKAKAGTAFAMTADAGVVKGYAGTPTVVEAHVKDHNGDTIATKTLVGEFGAAVASGGRTVATGSDFKYLDVGTIQLTKDAVVDSEFTKVDQSSDCIVGSSSNSLVGGKYGCNIGAVPVMLGRWFPSYYSFLGTLTPGCPAGTFTYMGADALGATLTVKARAMAGASPDKDDPVTSRYNKDLVNDAKSYPSLAKVSIAGDNNGTPVAMGRLISPAFPTMPSAENWKNGVFSIEETYAFSRPATPDGPFEAYRLVASVDDPDGASLIGTADEKATNTTRIRYGRLSLGNAYGSELLDLPIPLEAQYWAGNYYATNVDDSCTVVPAKAIGLDLYKGNLNACETFLSAGTMTSGKVPLKLGKPGPGNNGSVELALYLDGAAGKKTCVSSTEENVVSANFPWLGPNPTARATFGIFKTPLIYRREVYRR